ncbi:hypothetical protein HPC49_50650 [Pyxidicoccus fallax]|nr:hypothetical protein [Pyxidicoccus fallax]
MRTSAVPAAPRKPSGAEPAAPDTATWPVDTFQLDARRHLFRISSGLATLGTLEPDVEWRIAETTPLGAQERNQPMPTLFYRLTGGGVAADAAVGIVSRKQESLRGASGLMLFTVGAPTSVDNLPERYVTLTNGKTGHTRRLTVHPEWMTAGVERAFLLTGLEPEETYRLTVEPVGEGAFLLGRARGPSLAVACVQQVTEDDPSGLSPARAGRFLLTPDAEVRLNGMRGLHCGFVDDDASDNEGAVRVRVERSRSHTADRPAAASRTATAKASLATRGQASKVAPTAAVVPAQEAAPGEEATQEGTAANAYARGQALFRAKQYAHALARARDCLKLAPEHANCLLLAGSASARLDRFEDGAKYYQRFLEVAPADHPQASMVIRLLQEYEGK